MTSQQHYRGQTTTTATTATIATTATTATPATLAKSNQQSTTAIAKIRKSSDENFLWFQEIKLNRKNNDKNNNFTT